MSLEGFSRELDREGLRHFFSLGDIPGRATPFTAVRELEAGTLLAARSYAGRLDLKVVSHEANRGVTAARNSAMGLAKAPRLLFLAPALAVDHHWGGARDPLFPLLAGCASLGSSSVTGRSIVLPGVRRAPFFFSAASSSACAYRFRDAHLPGRPSPFPRYQGGEGLGSAAGIYYKENGQARRAPERKSPDIESLPFVYQGKAAQILRCYLERGAIRESTGYEGSRGCAFCCSPDFPRYLAALREAGLAWIGNIRINMLDAETMRLLEESGCRWAYFGEVRAGLEVMRTASLSCGYPLIAGLPSSGAGGGIDRCLDLVEELRRLQPAAEILASRRRK
ncbi:MAG: hypothetical protein A2506_05015 [Elusimicrobia bacterium RIFOXYD12_FULL_66_9]|nr:MAG: hypothetical protein A2506_05015 [Elusimicrobia bacterium RIFOXYD12_FULL_66_9]